MERVAIPPSRSPASPPPAGACDCHTHIFGRPSAYPVAHPPHYLLPDADAKRHRQMLDETGLSRAVLVQPAPYGDDCGAIIEAIAEAPATLRGIGTAFAGTGQDHLAALKAAGIVGLRFVHLDLPGGTNRFPGAAGLEDLHDLAPAMAEIGLHAQLWCDAATFAEHRPALAQLGLPIVLEHMARFDTAAGVTGTAFEAVLAALAEGEAWVKLALCRASQQVPDYPDIRRFHDALVAANPQRLLWASDWPHVRLDEARPDVGHLLDLFAEWTGHDAALAQRILVHNPADLYGFDSPSRQTQGLGQ
jgi:2-pyrone-4,6-dicarboxylate lactonase